jgi:hypothetical protein
MGGGGPVATPYGGGLPRDVVGATQGFGATAIDAADDGWVDAPHDGQKLAGGTYARPQDAHCIRRPPFGHRRTASSLEHRQQTLET